MAKVLTAKDIAYYKNAKYDPKVIANYDCDYDNPQYRKIVAIARNDVRDGKPIRKATDFANDADYNLYKYKLTDFALDAEYDIPW